MPAQPTVIKLTSTDDTYTAAAGDYVINGLGGNDTITTGAGNSTLNLGDGNVTITTGAGNSIVNAGNGNSTITTGAGNSIVTVGDGNATITTGAGDSTVTAGKGNNTITTGAGNNTVHTLAGDQTVTTGAGNDEIDVGVGSSTVVSAAGNDVLIYHAAGNQHTSSTFDGGTGIDTLRLALTRAEWMSDAVQSDVAHYLAFLAANTGAAGEASAAAFKFSAFDLTARGIENLQVTVDGVKIDPANHPVTLGNDMISTTENEASLAIDVLGNDSVPDLIKTLTYTNPTNGSVHLNAAYSDTASPAAAQFIYTPAAGFYDHLALGETATDTFTYTVTDATGDVKTATVNVTITGTNDAPVITSATQAATVSEGNDQPYSAMSASGTVSYSDVDLTDTHTLSISAAAAHGNASVDALGNWSYTVADAGAVNALAVGEHLADSFTVLVDDGHGGQALQSVQIDITGTNDVPVITSTAQTGAVKEDATLIATGTVASSDVDHGATAVYSGSTVGVYGSFAINASTGVWTYTLNNTANQNLAQGESQSETFTVTVTDDQGATASQNVVLSITGTNDAPVITSTAQAGAVKEDTTLTATGTVASGDVDHGATAAYSGSTVGIYGNFAVNASTGVWTYTLDNAGHQNLAQGESQSETFTVTVTDDKGATASQNVVLSITGTNDAPVITSAAQAGAVKEDTTLTATGTVASSDVDHGATTAYSGSTVGIYGNFAVNASTGVWTYTLDNAGHQNLAQGESQSETFTVTVTDDKGATASQNVVLSITGTNDAPVITSAAQAGAVKEDTTLTATGTVASSDVDHGATAAYSSSTVGVYGNFAVNASTGVWTYTLDNAGHQNLAQGESQSETFTVTVTDDKGSTATQAVNMTITGTNDAPTITVLGTDAMGAVTEDATTLTLSDTGVIAFNDVDLTDAHTTTVTSYASNTLGGTLVMGAAVENASTESGTVGWTYNVNNNATQYLAEGQTAIEKFNVTVSDGHSATVTQLVAVTVTGTNDAPVIGVQDVTGAVTAVAQSVAPPAGPLLFTVQQYLGFHANNLATLQSYAASHAANYTVQTNVIDYTDDTGGFAGDIPGSFRWPAAVAQNVYNTSGINDNFFARITANFSVTTADTYTFRTYNDDGVFLLIDNNLVISDTSYHPETPFTGSIALAPGNHSIELFFFEGGGEASLELSVRSSTGPYGLLGTTGGGLGGVVNLVSDSGTISFSDVDLSDTHSLSAVTPVTGALGTLTASMSTDTSHATGLGGAITWNYNVSNAALAYLAAGETKIETFSFNLLDGKGGSVLNTVNVTITGTNEAPVITSAAQTGAVKEDITLTATGTVASSDVDHFATAAYSGSTAGVYGSFAVNASTGVWTYTLNNAAHQNLAQGESQSETFTVTVTDDKGATASQAVVMSITGTNDAPVITSAAQTGAVKEDTTLTATGTVASSDVDRYATATYNGNTVGTYGSFAVNAATGAWTYTLNNAANQNLAQGETQSEIFTVQVTDDKGATATQSVNMIITGTNDAPVITSAAQAGVVKEDTTLTATGTVASSDVDHGATATYSGNTAGVYGSFAVNAATGVWTYTLDNAGHQNLAQGESKSETFTVTVTDDKGATATQNVVLSITGTNDAPIAINDIGSATEAGGISNSLAGSNATGNVLNNDTDIDTASSSFTVTAVRVGSTEGVGTAGVPGSALSGAHGTLTLNANGDYSYAINQNDAAVQALNVGGKLTDTFNYTMQDGSLSDKAVLTITINGANDAPVVPAVTLTVNQLGNGGFEATPDFSGWHVSTATSAMSSVYVSTATINRSGTSSQSIAGDAGVAVLTVSGVVPNGYGTGYGPTITSDAFAGQAGDKVKFVYELLAGSDQAKGTGYIRDAGTNAIVQTIFDYLVPVIGSTGVKTVDLTLAHSGNFIIDFRVGSYDATGGTVIGATLKLGFAGIIREGLSQDTAFTFAGTNFLSGVTDVDGGTAVLSGVSATSTHGASVTLSGGSVNYNPAGALKFLGVEESLVDTFQLTVSDGKGGLVNSTASVTVFGVNDAPVITTINLAGAVTEQVTPAGNLNTTGTIAFTDDDLSDVHSISAITPMAGALGTLTASVNNDSMGSGVGEATWNYSVADSAVEYLAAGQTRVETFSFNLRDNQGGISVARTVSVTITGTNDVATISGSDTGSVAEDTKLTASGTLSVADVDNGEAVFRIQTNSDGIYGKFSIDTLGSWNYALNNTAANVQALNTADHVSDHFTVLSQDGTAKEVTISIDGKSELVMPTPVSSTIDFEDVLATSGLAPIPDGYRGFNWDVPNGQNLYVINENYHPGSGYERGSSNPGMYAAFNPDAASPINIHRTNDADFTFNKVYVTGAWQVDQVTFQGFNNGVLIGTTGQMSISNLAPSLVEVNWAPIDNLRITIIGSHVVFDNFSMA